MRILNPLPVIQDLGFKPVLFNAAYRLGVLSGFYRLLSPQRPYPAWEPYQQGLPVAVDIIERMLSATRPDRAARAKILAVADELTQGTVQLFGATPSPLDLGQEWRGHWCSYETGRMELGQSDIKDIWEPARFSWAVTLAQAYHLSGDEKYPAAFWEQVERFLDANPPNRGPHWMNGQEVALRLIALVFAWQAFYKSAQTTRIRTGRLRAALVMHARRIRQTLVYAASQRNNHLLSEAAGLYTAGIFLEGTPGAGGWRRTGWRLFNQALKDQLSPDGSYIQQSVNYHRLMLHLALWVELLASHGENPGFCLDILTRLRHATAWLENLCSPTDGTAPNMGSNDGANIFPLGSSDSLDFRPVLELCRLAFPPSRAANPVTRVIAPEQVITLRDHRQWAFLRVARYHGRPGHADQLHLDLWWREWNIALDAGSYRYNHPRPWDNSLAKTVIHNTVTVNDRDQMIRAGRFLWLRPARIINLAFSETEADGIRSVTAAHSGYLTQGVLHQRTVDSRPAGVPGWLVRDELQPAAGSNPGQVFSARATWLLPDWDWDLEGPKFILHSPAGPIRIECSLSGAEGTTLETGVFRGGLSMTPARQADPTWGWRSPHYGSKEPAVALHFTVHGTLPLIITTRWTLPR